MDVVVELWDSDAPPGALGTELGLWDEHPSRLPQPVWDWMEQMGWLDETHPERWVNVLELPKEQWAPNNHPTHEMTTTI